MNFRERLQWEIQDFPDVEHQAYDGTYYLADFSQKMHETEEILMQRGRSSLRLLGSTNGL